MTTLSSIGLCTDSIRFFIPLRILAVVPQLRHRLSRHLRSVWPVGGAESVGPRLAKPVGREPGAVATRRREHVVAALEPKVQLVIGGKELTLERFEQQIDG